MAERTSSGIIIESWVLDQAAHLNGPEDLRRKIVLFASRHILLHQVLNITAQLDHIWKPETDRNMIEIRDDLLNEALVEPTTELESHEQLTLFYRPFTFDKENLIASIVVVGGFPSRQCIRI